MSNYDDRNRNGVMTIDPEEPIRPATGSEPDSAGSTSASVDEVANQHPASFATRASVVQAEGISKGKLLLLGGGLAIDARYSVRSQCSGLLDHYNLRPGEALPEMVAS